MSDFKEVVLDVKAVNYIDAGLKGKFKPGQVFQLPEKQARQLALARAVTYVDRRREKAVEKEVVANEKAKRVRIPKDKHVEASEE